MRERQLVGWLVGWCFEPSQPHRLRQTDSQKQKETDRQKQKDRQTDTQRQKETQTQRDRDRERICAFDCKSNAHLTSSFIGTTAS